MKRLFHILFLACGMLAACTAEKPYADEPQSHALLGITVITDGAGQDDLIRQARYITFDNASFSPGLDVNQVVQFNGAEQEATKFSTELKVSCNGDKMLLVILNEPASLTPILNEVKTLHELSGLNFQMAAVFGPNHQAPEATGLPMTGTVRNIAVTSANTISNPAQAEVTVYRSVARVELWLKTDQGATASVNNSTSVKLSKTTGTGYLFKPDPTYGFGYMQTGSEASTSVNWNYTGGVAQDLNETAQFICAFYVPERTCTASGDMDKLVLDLMDVNTPGGPRSLHAVLSDFSIAGGPATTVELYERNNVYRLTGLVKDLGIEFEHDIIPWEDLEQSVIIDPQYYLRVSADELTLRGDGPVSVTAMTDYDRDDRGYPAGVLLGNIFYYDPDGSEVTSGWYYGWAQAQALGAEGSLVREIRINSLTSISSGRGYYAQVEVKAGNAIKMIRINPVVIYPD